MNPNEQRISDRHWLHLAFNDKILFATQATVTFNTRERNTPLSIEDNQVYGLDLHSVGQFTPSELYGILNSGQQFIRMMLPLKRISD